MFWKPTVYKRFRIYNHRDLRFQARWIVSGWEDHGKSRSLGAFYSWADAIVGLEVYIKESQRNRGIWK